MAQRGRHLLGIEGRVERDEDGAELEQSIRQSSELCAVAEADGDAVALADADGGEGRGEAVGDEVEGVVGEGRFVGVGGWRAGDDGGTVAMLGDDGGEVVGDGACEEGGL